jgi:hypothetical protein
VSGCGIGGTYAPSRGFDGRVADAGVEALATVGFFGDDKGVVVLDIVSVITVVVLVQVLVVDSVTCAVSLHLNQ